AQALHAIVVGKKEGPILAVIDSRNAHGAAQRAAEVVAGGIDQAPAARVRKPVVCVQRIIAAEVVAHAVKFVGAALRDHVDDGAAGVAKLRAEIIRLYLELFHDVHGGVELHFGNAAVLFDAGDRAAVQDDLGRAVANTVGNEV